ncbi:hypothetical protein J2T57_003571 [Natronocella acetinitrilica]|uniref:Uncharacterized protein n=1 Tax=Natronocella acetinitrilica TaxID=414046 RepID=A0AAE3G5Z3_9GAMM|nr:hypothetical protein [Natronocella acetinitrilica]MCP1676410.1 hypothetical protein [Natronocella acetinitrilica]
MPGPLRRRLEAVTDGRPDVVLDVLFDDGLLYLTLQNLGSAHAHDVHVRFDRSIRAVEGTRDITALEIFRDLAFLPVGKRIEVFLDTSGNFFAQQGDTEFVAHIRFHDATGRQYQHRARHNLAVYRDLGYVRRSPV